MSVIASGQALSDPRLLSARTDGGVGEKDV